MPAVAARPPKLVANAHTDGDGEVFGDRAMQLVAFLIQRHGTPGSARRREQELAEWIAHWQRGQRHGWEAARHFVAEELGIILRALNGPPAATTRAGHPGHQQLCWLIAKCMNQAE